MSQNSNPVPRLDLAPKLSHPLSLWNPLDYLRLLYWVFFFPQALPFYIDTFGGNGFKEAKTLKDKWEWLRKNPIQRRLTLQALALIFVIPIGLNLFMKTIGIPINSSVFSWGMAWGVAWGVAWGIQWGINLWGAVWGAALGAVFGVLWGAVWGAVWGVVYGAVWDEVWRNALVVALSAVLGVVLGVLFGVVFGVVLGVYTRLGDWIFALAFTLLQARNKNRYFPHITPLPLPYLSSQVANWLRRDWETGKHNINQLLRFTLQFIPVVQAVNRALAETPPELLIYRVAQLADELYDWNLLHFVSASLNKFLKLQTLRSLFSIPFLPHRWQQRFNNHFETKMRLDIPASAAAGFLYLYQQNPAQATEAFAVVRHLPYGEEAFTLAKILSVFNQTNDPTLATIKLPASPNQPSLHLTAWEAIAALRWVIFDLQIVRESASESARSLALNRALGELQGILDGAANISQAERYLIINIAQRWQTALLAITREIGNISITEPVTNPYIIGDPVQTKLFVGREDIMRELKELWVVSHRLQSVVLYGHRRMGKTSILLNVGNILGAKVHLAYINLLLVGQSNQGVGEVLIKISDAISLAVNLPSPADEGFLKLPYITFERYLKQVVANLDGGLIIALDEFEKIEELIEAKKIDPDFMGFLRGLVQMSPKIAFALAGLHTLEEMTEDYFHPFFSSIIPIRVGFLSPGATRQILANPDDDFLLDYKPEAMDTIYQLTQGQPYLVQLIGFLLVRRYNDLVFEMGKTLDPVFTRDDVEAVINDPDFFIKGRYYFTGVWGQSAQGSPGQQEILKILAPHPEGINLDRIIQAINMDETTLNEAIETLKRHDVIQETNAQYHIIVELFRRWVLENK
ncbi:MULTISPECIES: AAA family ATPase [Kamptonema]|uniref:AAA family ATPase n=1 Tax=Kamptonema TaxID=1501433 RepID=UPI0001DACB90|nr:MULTISPECIES: ATP-binding protein [Kamptonema]CBN58671.1 conserved membrane hypothetical protein [Kamptonema sp. PCC 6506]